MAEKTDKIVYSFDERFYSLNKEQRIRGRQLFSRLFFVNILFIPVFMIFWSLWTVLFEGNMNLILMVPAVLTILYYGTLLYIIPKQIINMYFKNTF